MENKEGAKLSEKGQSIVKELAQNKVELSKIIADCKSELSKK